MSWASVTSETPQDKGIRVDEAMGREEVVMLRFGGGRGEEHAGASPVKLRQNSVTSDSGLCFVLPGHLESQFIGA